MSRFVEALALARPRVQVSALVAVTDGALSEGEVTASEAWTGCEARVELLRAFEESESLDVMAALVATHARRRIPAATWPTK